MLAFCSPAQFVKVFEGFDIAAQAHLKLPLSTFVLGMKKTCIYGYLAETSLAHPEALPMVNGRSAVTCKRANCLIREGTLRVNFCVNVCEDRRPGRYAPPG